MSHPLHIPTLLFCWIPESRLQSIELASRFPSVLSFKHQGEIQRLAETSEVIGKITLFWELPLFFSTALGFIARTRVDCLSSSVTSCPRLFENSARHLHTQPCLSSRTRRRGWRTGFLFFSSPFFFFIAISLPS